MNRFTSKTFTSSGSWICPAGINTVIVYGMGGGGAGEFGAIGESLTGGHGGIGGCANNLQPVILSVVPGTSYPITVGAGGVMPNSALSGNGGDTSFGALMTWVGASGGKSDTLNFMEYSSGGLGQSFFQTSSAVGHIFTGMTGWASGGAGAVGNNNDPTFLAKIGQCGSSGIPSGKGGAPIATTNGGNGGGGASGCNMINSGKGGDGGNGAFSINSAAVGTTPAANTGAGGGGGGGGKSGGGIGARGGDGGSGLLIVMWVE